MGKPGVTEQPPLARNRRNAVVATLRARGVTQAEIAGQLGVSQPTVCRIERREDVQALMRAIREAARREFVESALTVQRRYFGALESLPCDIEHASAHQKYAAALGLLADKAALAAGEVTSRVESRTIALNLTEKQHMLAQLEESQRMHREREALATEHRRGKVAKRGSE